MMQSAHGPNDPLARYGERRHDVQPIHPEGERGDVWNELYEAHLARELDGPEEEQRWRANAYRIAQASHEFRLALRSRYYRFYKPADGIYRPVELFTPIKRPTGKTHLPQYIFDGIWFLEWDDPHLSFNEMRAAKRHLTQCLACDVYFLQGRDVLTTLAVRALDDEYFSILKAAVRDLREHKKNSA